MINKIKDDYKISEESPSTTYSIMVILRQII